MANGKVYCADCRARDRFYRQYPIGTLKHNPDVERSKLEAPVAEALRALIPGERFATQQSVIPVDLDLHPPTASGVHRMTRTRARTSMAPNLSHARPHISMLSG